MKKGALYFLFFIGTCAAHIETFLAQFRRPFTMLEITDTQSFQALSCAHAYNGVFVLLSKSEKIDSLKKKVQDYQNIVLVNPIDFGTDSIVQLASCEHFDLTYVHDWATLKSNPYIVGALLGLGDYLIVDAPRDFADQFLADYQSSITHVEQLGADRERIFFYHQKTSLGKARWYMSSAAQARQPSYAIVSNFNQKKMVKGAYKKTTDWVPGINLVTAIMLRLIYPTNEILRENIKKFMDINHNDPVIGNMIVQGSKLALIDFADARRNADQEKCLKAALKLFTWIHRPKDPYVAMQKYSEYVHG